MEKYYTDAWLIFNQLFYFLEQNMRKKIVILSFITTNLFASTPCANEERIWHEAKKAAEEYGDASVTAGILGTVIGAMVLPGVGGLLGLFTGGATGLASSLSDNSARTAKKNYERCLASYYEAKEIENLKKQASKNTKQKLNDIDL